MHAGTAASLQQSNHVQQHNTKQSAMGHTMGNSEDQQTADSKQRDLGWGAEATEIFTEACFVAFVLSDWRVLFRQPIWCCCWEGSHWTNKGKDNKNKSLYVFKNNIMCIVQIYLRTDGVYLERRNVQECLNFEEV